MVSKTSSWLSQATTASSQFHSSARSWGLVQVDGIHLTLPNSTVWNATITNYSRNKTRRLDIPVPVRYGDDLEVVLAKLKEIVDARPDALKDPEPLVKVFEYIS